MNDLFRGELRTQAQYLLLGYQTDSAMFFASSRQTLLAQGHYATVPAANSLDALNQAVALALKQAKATGHLDPVVVGAIPFDGRKSACLSIPRSVLRAGPLPQSLAQPKPQAVPCSITPLPEPQAYADGVALAVQHLQNKYLDKVVLARALDLAAEQVVDIPKLLVTLAQRNAHGYTFAVNLSGQTEAPPRILIGASPELLLRKKGSQVFSNPLAGSAARSPDPKIDRERGEALLQSAKDLHEHAVVVNAVAAGLRPFCRTLIVPERPVLMHTETMWHLSTEISGELIDEETTSLMLASALHPTPAVCGHPNQNARDLIAQIEPFDRGFYTGMLGWCDANGDGEWIVTIRCAEVAGKSLRLFAGAGIVADSSPQSELAETSAKFRTMLNAMGLVHAGAV
ncbi:isochorismate synthase DhbC [Iodobacter sp. LRB]|uniref:isochorismate synthase DhbC n=1 Tax=unclassified Iodobacter TaxID=235634 RepID=UPI000C11FC83|nr:isochorismate synthase DhbC [Iodobacter sp. BJB302]PHV03205.1 isochorismate synthase [Iodobacter sp. BJB302]